MPDKNTAPPFELPANASRACPACGGPWTYGYVVKKLPNQPGAGRGKWVYKKALECRNDGCGLGYFVGSEITHAETEGLELIDREKRKKEVLRVVEDEGTAKRWAKNYDACIECGRTDSPATKTGLCRRCYARKKYREKSGGVVKPKKPRTAPMPKARAKDDGDLVEVNFVVKLRDLSPELQAEIKAQVAEKLADRVLAGLGGR